MLETKCIGDNFEMLVTDLRCWWPFHYIEKMILSVIGKGVWEMNLMNLVLFEPYSCEFFCQIMH